jgi:hypothetical protein
MASFVRISSALLLGAALVHGQSSATSLAAAQQTVSSSSLAGVPYSEAETVQLTTEVLQNVTSELNATIASYFDFGNGTASNARRSSSSACRVFPGDEEWPLDILWDILDLLLGGSLIKTTPSASSCYPGWGDESTSECSYVTSAWNLSYFQ